MEAERYIDIVVVDEAISNLLLCVYWCLVVFNKKSEQIKASSSADGVEQVMIHTHATRAHTIHTISCFSNAYTSLIYFIYIYL